MLFTLTDDYITEQINDVYYFMEKVYFCNNNLLIDVITITFQMEGLGKHNFKKFKYNSSQGMDR